MMLVVASIISALLICLGRKLKESIWRFAFMLLFMLLLNFKVFWFPGLCTRVVLGTFLGYFWYLLVDFFLGDSEKEFLSNLIGAVVSAVICVSVAPIETHYLKAASVPAVVLNETIVSNEAKGAPSEDEYYGIAPNKYGITPSDVLNEPPREEIITRLLSRTPTVVNGENVFLLSTEDGFFTVKPLKGTFGVSLLKKGTLIRIVIKGEEVIAIEEVLDIPSAAVPLEMRTKRCTCFRFGVASFKRGFSCCFQSS